MSINWPKSKTIDALLRDIRIGPEVYIGQRFAPVINSLFHEIEYDVLAPANGLLTAHALGADVRRTEMPAVEIKSFKPAYFKEARMIDERDMLLLRKLGSEESQRAYAQDLINEAAMDLRVKLEARIEHMRWLPLYTGGYNILQNGVAVNANYSIPGGQLPRTGANPGGITVTADWNNAAAAVPLSDIMDNQQAFATNGYQLAKVVMNSATAQLFCLADDTRQSFYGQNIGEKILPGNLVKHAGVLLPGVEFAIYDGGYTTVAGGGAVTFHKFIPDNHVIMLANAPAGEIIDVVSVPAILPDADQGRPGMFGFAVDKTGESNPYYEVVAGFYGLTRIRRPDMIRAMDITQA